LIYTPRPWQHPMIAHLVDRLKVNIWADMGSGKSSSVLTALNILHVCGYDVFPVLILAPLRVARDVWPAEAQRWDHTRGLSVVCLAGGTETDRRRALYRKADIFTMNYENIEWLIAQCGEKWPFKTVVCDESTRLKGFRLRTGTKRAAALASIARRTPRWINLTGTPASNGLKDLWGQNWFLDFGERLGRTWTDFKNRWFDYDPYTMSITAKPHAQNEIQDRLRDITLTIRMKDWVDLREPIKNTIRVHLDAATMRQYRQLEREMFTKLKSDVELTAITAAARTTKCLQFAAGAAYHEGDKWTDIHDVKLNALESIIEETAGANLLVAYWWQHDAIRICKKFKHARVLRSTKDFDDWNAGKIPLGLVHPQSAGHGLNLQHGGHHIAFFSDWWNLEARLQVIERIGPTRQMQSGYDRPVYIHQIVVAGTVDEDVVERHETKADVQNLLMAAMRHRRTDEI
jgi:hypothetical protein